MNDTIAAISTAYGEGGIGIIRISGPQSYRILSEIFDGKISNRSMCYGMIHDGEHIIDEVLSVFMKAPHTYTAEDVVEINCHGSMVSLKKTLSLVLKKGARLADPGEFTKRAFLNGRMDLSQAEAVIDLIKAKSDKGFDVALSQLEGSFSKCVEEIRSKLLDLLVEVTVNIDYPDEDIEVLTFEKMETSIQKLMNQISSLLATADSGRMIREGIRIAIVGKPNVGKSSLMNALLRESRAIVTEIPGTTRDTIEEVVNIRGLPVYLIDTAGIHETDDVVETIGIEKSKTAFNEADFIFLIFDGSKPFSDEDFMILDIMENRNGLILINKSDLGIAIDTDCISGRLPNCDLLFTSILHGEGISQIEDKIENLVYGGDIYQKESVVVNNIRHIHLLEQAEKSLQDSLFMILSSEPLDIVEIDLRNAYDSLGEISGETVSEDILNEVFSRFCLGK